MITARQSRPKITRKTEVEAASTGQRALTLPALTQSRSTARIVSLDQHKTLSSSHWVAAAELAGAPYHDGAPGLWESGNGPDLMGIATRNSSFRRKQESRNASHESK